MTATAWKKANSLYLPEPGVDTTAIYCAHPYQAHPKYFPPGEWHDVDYRSMGIAEDAHFAILNVHLVISDLDPDINNLTLTARAPGDTLGAGNYQAQAITVWTNDGHRGVQQVVQPLVGGIGQLYWKAEQGGVPAGGGPTTYLLNGWVSMYGTYEDTAAVSADPGSILEIPLPADGRLVRLLPQAG